MDYLSMKALHIVFNICWMAGLFYLVRLYVYHVEALARKDSATDILHQQFSIMEKKLMFAITLPSALISLATGIWLIVMVDAFKQPWFHLKALLVVLLLAYTHLCGKWRKKLAKKEIAGSSFYFRVQNEVATILMVGIVFSAVTKQILHGLVAMLVFTLLAGFTFWRLSQKKT